MSDFVSVRLTKAERAKVRAAAEGSGMTVSAWLRMLMQHAADDASHID